MRLLNYENHERIITITIQKDISESVGIIEAKLRLKVPQLQNKMLKLWVDIDENEQVFIFTDKKNEKNIKTRQLLLD